MDNMGSPGFDWSARHHQQQQQQESPSQSVIPHFDKLIVPPSMRSIYWKYFGFPGSSEGQIITRMKIVCTICQQLIVYNRNTSNLRVHLQTHHPHELRDLEVSSSLALGSRVSNSITGAEGRVSNSIQSQGAEGRGAGFPNLLAVPQPAMVTVKEEFRLSEDSGSGHIGSRLSEDSGSGHVGSSWMESEGDDLTMQVSDFLLQDLLPLDIVDGPGFRRLLGSLSPSGHIPTAARLEEGVLPHAYATLHSDVQEYVRETPHVSLCLETWESLMLHTHITASVTCVGNEAKVLRTIRCHNWKASNFRRFIVEVMEEWGIKSKIIVVASSEPLLRHAIQVLDMTAVPCLVHSIQKAVEELFFIPEVATTLRVARSIQFSEVDYPPMWTTTYAILERCKGHDNIAQGFLKDILDVLCPLTVAMATLSNTPMSIIKPLLSQLERVHMRQAEGDSPLSKRLKATVLSCLTRDYDSEQLQVALQTASFLDPRFRAASESNPDARQLILSRLKTVMDESGPQLKRAKASASSSPSSEDKKCGASSSTATGMAFLLGDLVGSSSEASVQKKVEVELAQYTIEEGPSLESCPLQWWEKTKGKCPYLASMATEFLCVPAAVLSGVATDEAIMFHRRRAALPVIPERDSTDRILFLHWNSKRTVPT